VAEQERATKVARDEWSMGPCPVCNREIVGTVTIEVRLGAARLERTSEGGPRVHQDMTTDLRSLDVQHTCLPRDLRNRQAEG
jgi:hypothetical protein